jgi:hypothetical protein
MRQWLGSRRLNNVCSFECERTLNRKLYLALLAPFERTPSILDLRTKIEDLRQDVQFGPACQGAPLQ